MLLNDAMRLSDAPETEEEDAPEQEAPGEESDA